MGSETRVKQWLKQSEQKYKNTKNHLAQLHNKLSELVWYARRPAYTNETYWLKSNIETQHEELKNKLRIENKYPEETANISDNQEGDYFHGFNSGMLAAIRYLKIAMNEEISTAKATPPRSTNKITKLTHKYIIDFIDNKKII